jgi:ATP-dependent exoDNAse (exonuclease V) beta subunit
MDAAGYELRLSSGQRANVERFLGELRGLLRRQSLDAVVEDLERMREADPRDADPQSEEREDRVTLQTMHSAKGLEFPVVILPALHTRTAADAACAEFAPGLGLGVTWRNPVTGEAVRDPASRRIAEWKSAQQNKEADRLLYVAMTRAEERGRNGTGGHGRSARRWTSTRSVRRNRAACASLRTGPAGAKWR